MELDVSALLDDARRDRHISTVVDAAAAALEHGTVVVSTSRDLVSGHDSQNSLTISRRVSSGLAQATEAIVARRLPSFIIAKGGITSSDIATDALHIDRAWVRGSLLPGIVSLWEAASGPARGIPYIVFAGNVGDDESLADVVDRLEGK